MLNRVEIGQNGDIGRNKERARMLPHKAFRYLLAGIAPILLVVLAHGSVCWADAAEDRINESYPLRKGLSKQQLQRLEEARLRAFEDQAIGELRALVSSLVMFQSGKQSYPDEWGTDMSRVEPDMTRAFAPPDFEHLDIQTSKQAVGGYFYLYVPMPQGCREPNCRGYTISAVPKVLGKTGSRSFLVDQSGEIRHCVGRASIEELPTQCR